MATKKSKIVPSRGIMEDWSNEKEEKLLEQKKEYSKKMMEQQILGSPDFESKYGDILVRKNRKNRDNK